MDIRKVKKLIELLEESGVAEIEIHEGEESVRISRHMPGAQVAAAPMMMMPAAPAAAPAGCAASCGCSTARAGNSSRSYGEFTHGWHFLPILIAGCFSFCRGWFQSQCRRHAVHH